MWDSALEIREESQVRFAAHGETPIGFWVRSKVDLAALTAGRIAEIPCEPFFKDYDVFEDDRPANLPTRFDVHDWVLLAAYLKGRRIGGVILAQGASYPSNEGREDLATIVDIRVHPDARGKGVGSSLIRKVLDWAARNQVREIRMETQDVNVAACRFYQAVGATTYEITEGAYLPELREARIIWKIAV